MGPKQNTAMFRGTMILNCERAAAQDVGLEYTKRTHKVRISHDQGRGGTGSSRGGQACRPFQSSPARHGQHNQYPQVKQQAAMLLVSHWLVGVSSESKRRFIRSPRRRAAESIEVP